jgi:hypothetical protein
MLTQGIEHPNSFLHTLTGQGQNAEGQRQQRATERAPKVAPKKGVFGHEATSRQTLSRRPAARPTLLGHLFDVRDE